jgi:Kef-type K+ transport system membrane component KefB/Trk K+ transport system NAD-binding subunit
MNLDPFSEIGALIAVATVMSLLMRFLKQPLIVGHIITGFLVGHYALGIFQSMETLELFSHLGIAFLLFSVGLNLNPKVLKQYGFASVLNTFGQVFLTGGVGVLVCMLLGYGWVTSLYVGVAISFSSTVIVLKLLSDKGDLDKLYVKVSIGSLLLQDLIAILLLFAIPILTGSSGGGQRLLSTLGWGVGAGVSVFLVANYIIRYLHPYLTRSQELLFLFANAWAIGIAILFSKIGFSLEGGALLAGVALSSLPSSHEISARLTPLRDFFIVTFFILLGTRMVVSDFQVILIPAIVLSLFVLIINPLIQLIIMGVLGYRKKTSFQTGMMAAQISEFSLILVGLGVTLGQVSPSVLSTVTLVGIITIFVSTYFIFYSDKLYVYFAPLLGIFERKHVRERAIKSEQRKIILIGGGRVSYDFIHMFQHEHKDFLVIDHDPEVLASLKREGIACEYGDATDPDFLEDMKLSKAELIISTSPDLETNEIIISVAKRHEKSPLIIVVAHRINNALELYESGADYVILPHFLGGRFAATLLKRYTKGEVEITEIRDKHIAQLKSRAEHGHEHPQIERFR